jgi:hypothetical protein
MRDFKKDPLFQEVKKYWDAYPRRKNGSKGNLYTVYLWFKAEKPDEDSKADMMQWMIDKQENMIHCEKNNIFCEAPKDMERWLENVGWITPIQKMVDISVKRNGDINTKNQEKDREMYTDWILEQDLETLKNWSNAPQNKRLKPLVAELRPEIIEYCKK